MPRVCYLLAVTRLTSMVVVAGLLWPLAAAAGSSDGLFRGWAVARSPHFEVYSHSGPDRARAALGAFEQLRSLFAGQHVLPISAGPQNRPPIRVIEFSSKREYEQFAIRRTADAYYTGTADRDYIVTPPGSREAFTIAGHEYAHFLLHSRGLKLPSWLSEGLAEVFSTVTISRDGAELGGPIRSNIDVLSRDKWLKPEEVFAAGPSPSSTRAATAVFYAESWAVVDMLM